MSKWLSIPGTGYASFVSRRKFERLVEGMRIRRRPSPEQKRPAVVWGGLENCEHEWGEAITGRSLNGSTLIERG